MAMFNCKAILNIAISKTASTIPPRLSDIFHNHLKSLEHPVWGFGK